MTAKDYTIIILFVTCVLLWLTRGCGHPTDFPTVNSTVVTVYDTTIKVVTRYRPSPSDTVTLHRFDTVRDTVQVVRRWERELFTYSDTIADTNLRAVISDSIYQNRIISRQFAYQILRPTEIHVTQPIAPDRFKLALSGVAMLSTSHAWTPNGFGIGAEVSGELPSGLRLGLSYAGGSGHFVTVRAGQVLSFRRRR